MSRVSKLLTATLFGGLPWAVLAADVREVRVQIEPPQRIVAIVLESNGTSVPVTVTNGKAIVPAELPLPWKVAQLRFEPVVYTRADLDAQRPLMLREFGRIRGSVREG